MVRLANILFMISILSCTMIVGCQKKVDKKTLSSHEPRVTNRKQEVGKKANKERNAEGKILSPAKYGREDPFDPTFNESGESSSKGLRGIIWDEQDPRAIIDNKIVRVGDKLLSCTVVEIKERSVILNDEFGDYELNLGDWER